MEQTPESTRQDSATAPTEDLLKLRQSASSGASWFYWIAGLSLINSAVVLFGGEWSFIVGLGVTQVIDAIALGVGAELSAGAATTAKLIALVGDALAAGVFVLFGIFANKRQAWAFVVGMVLYAFDGMIFLLVADWLSIGFHAFALFCIWGGFSASRKLAGVTLAPTEPARPEPITP